MKPILTSLITLSFLLVFSVSTVSANDLTALSAWKNQSGSTFTIDTVDPTGEITGTYVNRAPATGCQNTPFPLVGYVNGNAITWSVSWVNGYANCNSTTGWTGFYENGQITTYWNLSYFASTGGQIEQGKDIFSPIAAEMMDSLVSK